MAHRHTDTGVYLGQFWQDEHWLVCACGHLVIAHYTACQNCGKHRHHLYCTYCHFHKDACQSDDADARWRLVVFCEHCRKTHHIRPSRHDKHLPHTLKHKSTPCPDCAKLASVIKAEQIYYAYPTYQGAFGLTLYLREPTRFGELWAFNPHQLSALKAYVSADLRERTAQATNSSYFARLPAWIKSAKNRDEILRAIAKLTQKSRALGHDFS